MAGKETVDGIWQDVRREAADRKPGAFKRALWYGNKSRLFGQNKGLRKAGRNAPRKILAAGIGVATAVVPPGISDLLEEAAGLACDKIKDIYGQHFKAKIRGTVNPADMLEVERKNLKAQTKDLKANALAVIDRNLVKLRDAKNAVGPARDKVELAQKQMANPNLPNAQEVLCKEAHAALRACAEFDHYIDKLAVLVATTKTALESMQTNLGNLKQASEAEVQSISDFVATELDEFDLRQL